MRSYLSIKNKYYLNGFDWVMGVIDTIMRRTTGAGNASQVVFVLDAPLDEAAFKGSLRRFLALFPVISGSVVRQYPSLAPYWKVEADHDPLDVPITVTKVDDEESLMSALGRFINTPFAAKNIHLAFHLLGGKDIQAVAMTFDHRLFDARGAESFVNLFQEYLVSGEDGSIADGVRLSQGIDLNQWTDKFKAGQSVSRKIKALSKESILSLPVSLAKEERGFRHLVLAFDSAETAAIYDRAYSVAGYLMIMPYLFANVFRALHKVFQARGITAGAYTVPASTDLRQVKDIRQALFFNHNSMFFFQIKPEIVDNMEELTGQIKNQLYEQVQSRFPQNLMKASSLTRIAPLWLMNRIFHLPLQGKIASFCFSHVSKCSYSSHMLMDSRITNVFHMPRMPVPPGIGIFFNTFDNRLNATISWLDGTFTPEEVRLLETELRGNL